VIRIREFALEDYDTIYELWSNAGPGIGLGRSDTREEVTKKLQRDPDLFLVAENDGKIVGTVIGGFDGRRGIIYHLAVEQAYRGGGIGRELMEEIERRLANKGCLRSYLLIKPEAAEVQDFYRDIGWQVMPITIMAKNLR
jgi:ribosomal protein S18 acetylase RimI-like enzyme